jgi:Ca2+-binding EF-hand superfamily protein
MANFKSEIWIGIGAIALGLSLPALAGTSSDHSQFQQKMMDRIDTDHDGKISDAEWKTATDKRFAKADVNSDGFVTEDELKAAHDKHSTEQAARRAEMRTKHSHTMFTRMDTNGDGKLSKGEFEAGSQKFRERMESRSQSKGTDGAGSMGDAPTPDKE